MELPSMVERSGGRLVVRSLVSGATVFQSGVEASEIQNPGPNQPLMDAELLDRQLQLLKNRTVKAVPHVLPVNIPTANREGDHKEPAAKQPVEPRVEDELPQCKIRRNYSCNSCAFFTQNPRSHLSHLRDVHGEKIVINECKLCLYASRHFQKLVRHMKMVHGCSDDDSTGVPGRRHCNREARKRRLEESIEAPSGVGVQHTGPTLKQLKSELQQLEQQLHNNVEELQRQQQLQQLQQMVSRSDNIFSMAFEFQMSLLPPTTGTIMPSIPSSRAEEPEREPENSSSDSEEQPQVEDCMTQDVLDLSAGGSSAAQYKCHKCSYTTTIRARFKKHVKYHSMPLIKCGSCDFHSPYKWNLDRHTKNHGANGYFKCNVCDFSTNIKQSLTIHELNHHIPAKRYPAQDQHQAVANESAERPETEPNPSPVKDSSSPVTELPSISCSHCQQRMTNAMELVSHLQQCEPALKSASQLASDMEVGGEEDCRAPSNDLSYCGVETAPGYGEVIDHLQSEDSEALKKVFKCPHCTFWAATASRFHVHIVGHLNRKPFECSLCSYRSNWRWDITKHIRLKAMRDKSHVEAQVLMNDETGRRNYAKYNQYLTLMKVSAEQAADAKTMRCGEMHPSNLEINLYIVNQMEEEPVETQATLEPQSDPMAALDLRMSNKPLTEQTRGHSEMPNEKSTNSKQTSKKSKSK